MYLTDSRIRSQSSDYKKAFALFPRERERWEFCEMKRRKKGREKGGGNRDTPE